MDWKCCINNTIYDFYEDLWAGRFLYGLSDSCTLTLIKSGEFAKIYNISDNSFMDILLSYLRVPHKHLNITHGKDYVRVGHGLFDVEYTIHNKKIIKIELYNVKM